MTRRETDDHYIYQYLDLVDETNGRAWVTADRPVDVYWKLPKGSDSNDDFKLVHFTGLDRQYDEETEGLIGQEGYEVEGVHYLQWRAEDRHPGRGNSI